jgi:hypothetical protein
MKVAADSWYDPGLSVARVVCSIIARGAGLVASLCCDPSPVLIL